MFLTTDMLTEVKRLNKELQDAISSRTGISLEAINENDIEEIEKEAKITPKPQKIFFMWEKGEKDGWQTQLTFVGDDVINKRERKMERELKN